MSMGTLRVALVALRIWTRNKLGKTASGLAKRGCGIIKWHERAFVEFEKSGFGRYTKGQIER